jgi:hypothetical protein
MVSSCATSARATVAPLTADRNIWLRPFASTMVEYRDDDPRKGWRLSVLRLADLSVTQLDAESPSTLGN